MQQGTGARTQTIEQKAVLKMLAEMARIFKAVAVGSPAFPKNVVAITPRLAIVDNRGTVVFASTRTEVPEGELLAYSDFPQWVSAFRAAVRRSSFGHLQKRDRVRHKIAEARRNGEEVPAFWEGNANNQERAHLRCEKLLEAAADGDHGPDPQKIIDALDQTY